MWEYPCRTYQAEVADNDKSILCDLCDKWHHTIYVNVSNANYEKLKVNTNPWLCPTCAEDIPFFDLANKYFKNQIVFLKNQSLKKVMKKQKFI